MSPRLHIHFVLIGCSLMVLAEQASAQIVECITRNGVITFRDVPCRAGEDALRIFGPDGTPRTGASGAAPGIKHAAVTYHRPTVTIQRVPADHGLSTDVATLKAAREVLASMDRLSKIEQHQALAKSD
jgi:hypothetical protein